MKKPKITVMYHTSWFSRRDKTIYQFTYPELNEIVFFVTNLNIVIHYSSKHWLTAITRAKRKPKKSIWTILKTILDWLPEQSPK
jgi:hypothetical protein